MSNSELEANDIWVFGYGSLIWKPDFPFVEQRAARLYGFHRDLCAYSVEHRGTVQRPGLVFALNRGGMCDGAAFRVAGSDAAKVITNLRIREQVTGVYRERVRPVALRTEDGTRFSETVLAVCYVVDPGHRQYAGRLPYAQQADLVGAAIGKAGANIDYVCNTHRALLSLGVRDRHLDRLIALMVGPRLDALSTPCGPLANRLRQVAMANGRRPRPGWSVRAQDELAVNHRKNLGY